MLLADEVATHHPVLSDNPYQPHMARIVRIYKMVENNHLFTLRFLEDHLAHSFRHQPGQFIMLSVPGAGEMPISISSSPSRPEVLELCVRRAGRVTSALYRLRTNDVVGVRGPYGNGYPMQEIAGNDVLLAAGGLGMAPLRSLLWYALDHRDKFNNITLMYGTKRPEDMLFREELLALVDRTDINCLLTVDADPSGTWKNHVGLLPTLFDHAKIDPPRTYAAVCGPPVVYKFILQRLLELGFPKNRILMSPGAPHEVRHRQVRPLQHRVQVHLPARAHLHLLGRHQPAGDDLMSKPTVGIFGLTGCAGDQLVILNCEDQLLDLVALIDIRDFLMASSENQTDCKLDIALVEGRGPHQRDAETLQAIRQRSKLLVALGTCAVWGGVAAMDRGADRARAARGSLRRHAG